MLQCAADTPGFIQPCLPSPAKTPPAAGDWLHEIKHDGFRILARRGRLGRAARFRQAISIRDSLAV